MVLTLGKGTTGWLIDRGGKVPTVVSAVVMTRVTSTACAERKVAEIVRDALVPNFSQYVAAGMPAPALPISLGILNCIRPEHCSLCVWSVSMVSGFQPVEDKYEQVSSCA